MSATRSQSTAPAAILYVAFELGAREWKLAFSSGLGTQPRLRPVAAGNLAGVAQEIARAKVRLRLPHDAPVRSCYEAGRDGFWLARWLAEQGIENRVVDSASIEVNRRWRRAKTDRLDGAKLVTMLIRYYLGETKVWKVVRVPSPEEEDRRHLHRDLGELKAERTRHVNRLKALLAAVGATAEVNREFADQLGQLRTWNGQALPSGLAERLRREFARWQCVDEQIRALESERARRVRKAGAKEVEQVQKLLNVRGVGLNSAWLLVMELFWRDIRNRRQLGGLAGLTPTPYDSGTARHEQGIGKAGNRRVRAMLIELAWGWLRYQPKSGLSRWYAARFANGNSRVRRIGIVALARKLLVQLWHYLEHREIPEGAELVSWRAKVNGKGRRAAEVA
jgi:transposase